MEGKPRRLCQRLFLIFRLLCLPVCVFTTLMVMPYPVRAEVVATFGDSITEGFGQVPYSSVLQQLISGNGYSTTSVRNYGLRGERTDHGVNRISSVLAQSTPRFITIMEGANDVNAGISAKTVAFNLGVMLDKSRKAGATPVLGNITPNTLLGRQLSSIPASYNPAISRVASAKGTRLVDGYNALVGNWANLNVDGLHPNNEGQRILGHLFFSVLPYTKKNPAGGKSKGTNPQVQSSGGSGGGGGGGGCFIATAAFGSINEVHVQGLRTFRDKKLLTNRPGRLFVKLYYHYSPPIAGFITGHDVVRHIVRYSLYPLIAFSWLCLHTSWPVALGTGMLCCVITLFLAWRITEFFKDDRPIR